MELVEGQTLSQFLPRNGLPLNRLLEIAIPLAAVKGKDDAMAVTIPPKPGDAWKLNVVRVDKPRDDPVVADIDHVSLGWHLARVAAARTGDTPAIDHYHGILDRRGALAVQQNRTHERDRASV